jgi:carbon monoxide dehydrogenase subunit G
MTQLQSDKAEVKRSPSEVFSFLSDFNNFEKLMPEQVVDWKSNSQSCSFTIKGMATLGMAIESTIPEREIRIRKDGKAPFDFFLTCKIEPSATAGHSLLQLVFDADLNPMLKMIAERPLTNFLNMLVKKFQEIS